MILIPRTNTSSCVCVVVFARLPIASYEQILKASHSFNVMDARGAVGVTERQKMFGEMRNLTRSVCLLWMERRKEMGFPLLSLTHTRGSHTAHEVNEDAYETSGKQSDDVVDGNGGAASAADFLLEIGSEELPAEYVTDGIKQLSASIPALLEQLRLTEYDSIRVNGTPRRLVVLIKNLPFRQTDISERVRGPPIRAAFETSDGSGDLIPTKAAIGFAKKNNVAVDELEQEGDYVWATVNTTGQMTKDVIAHALESLLLSMKWQKTMRWLVRPSADYLSTNDNETHNMSPKKSNDNKDKKKKKSKGGDGSKSSSSASSGGDPMWPRPLRWLVAIHGSNHIPFPSVSSSSSPSSCLGVKSDEFTRTMRRRRKSAADVSNARLDHARIGSVSEYLQLMEQEGIVLDMLTRREMIWEKAEELVASIIYNTKSGETNRETSTMRMMIPPSLREEGSLLDEVANLVESPLVLLGEYDSKFLSLPREVLETVMKKHQRYFPVADSISGELVPFFITVANGECDTATVIAGNEAVLRARYEDARFFFESDVKTPLMELRPKLKGIMFQEKLGTMLDKATRTELIAASVMNVVAAEAEMVEEMKDVVVKSAPLMYTDLATAMVMEFTGLAGVMGRQYALLQGESKEVSDAIFESVLPRNAGDVLPQSLPGCVLSISSRLDSLVGLFAAGCAPSASADPYGLRRVAYGLVETIIHADLTRVDVSELMRRAAEMQPVVVPDAVLDEALVFLRRRLEQYILDKREFNIELVHAVLAEQGDRPAVAIKSIRALSPMINEESFQKFVAAISRPTRIVRAHISEKMKKKEGKEDDLIVKMQQHTVDESLLCEEAEIVLWNKYNEIQELIHESKNTTEVLKHAQCLVGAIDAFFENVFVMAEDEKVRENRLAMLWKVAHVTKGYIDLSRLPGF